MRCKISPYFPNDDAALAHFITHNCKGQFCSVASSRLIAIFPFLFVIAHSRVYSTFTASKQCADNGSLVGEKVASFDANGRFAAFEGWKKRAQLSFADARNWELSRSRVLRRIMTALILPESCGISRSFEVRFFSLFRSRFEFVSNRRQCMKWNEMECMKSTWNVLIKSTSLS